VSIQFLQIRDGRLYFRRRVPEDVQDRYGKTEIRKSLRLKVGQEGQALARITRLNHEVEREFERLRSHHSALSEVDPRSPQSLTAVNREAENLGLLRSSRIPYDDNDLHDIQDAYLQNLEWELKQRAFDAGYTKEDLGALSTDRGRDELGELFEGLLKPDERRLVSILKTGKPEALKEMPLSVAYEFDKQHNGGTRNEKAIETAIRSFSEFHGDPNILSITSRMVQEWITESKKKFGHAPATIKRRLGALSALVNRSYLVFEIDRRNPFSGITIPGGTSSVNDRLPFNRDHLSAIESHLNTGSNIIPEKRAIIQLLKLTGARPSEIYGLEIEDVNLDVPIPYIFIRPNQTRTKLKTDKVSKRRVPLLPEAFTTLEIIVSDRKSGPLFSRTMRNSDSVSQAMNKIIRDAGVPKTARLVAYSFRHTMKEALIASDASERVQRRILGHKGNDSADSYGAPLGALKQSLNALERALPLLGDIDSSEYEPGQLITTTGLPL
jgi:integrase